MDQVLRRIFRLVRERGERIVVLDPEGGEPVVLLPLSQYEGSAIEPPEKRKNDPAGVPQGIPLTDTELLDKINEEIGTWQEGEKRPDDIVSVPDSPTKPSQKEDEGEEKFYIEPVKQ